jgi:hypothetical protein
MTDENSFLVEYRLTSASGDCGPYPPTARWAEPDLNHAAQLMRMVYEHPNEAARRAERGRSDLLLRHDVTASASAISRRLATIREARAATVAGAAAQPAPTADVIVRAPASEAFASALPQLRQLGEPRVTHDERSWQWLRRAAQRALFRVIRPYWFQQRQFQDALLDAVRVGFEQLAASGNVPPAAPPPQAEPLVPKSDEAPNH